MKLLITLWMVCCFHDVAAHKTRTHSAVIPVRDRQWHDDPAQCLDDGSNGSDYRGTISVTARGRRCLYWDEFEPLGATAMSQGLGYHRYCRNPDNSPMPWCRVRRHRRIIREFCHVPQCEAKPTTSLTQPEELKHDTPKTCGERTQKLSYRVVGGKQSTIESQPWVASIFKGEGFQCGGTLIAPCWVLTAAHCFPDGEQTSIHRYSVHLGKNAINATTLHKEQKFKLAKLIIHEDYKITGYNHDIALLQIKDNGGRCAQRTQSVRTACLPPRQQMLPPGSFCDIAGYGKEKSNSVYYSRFLKEAQVQLISQRVCQTEKFYGSEVTDNMFCAAGPEWSEDACQGDSGGPLVCDINGRMFLFGIISWGHGCAAEFKPGVYTKVSNYNQWIAQHTHLPSFTTGVMYPQKN